jgi:colanic acid biosynthesis glycosyl transferase WcaI
MRVALLSASYAPELTGIGPYSAELAEALAQRGHEVQVISSFPFYPDWVPRVPPGTFLYRTESVDGVRVTRCRIYVPSHPGPMRRLLHELSWVAAAFPAVVRRSRWADAWIVVSPAFGSALIGACLARFTSAPVHIHVQDLVPDVALESGQMTSRFLVGAARTVARWTYRSFRSASVLSESMAARFRHYVGGKEVGITVAPNWIRKINDSNGSLPLALQGRSYAVYAGSSGRKQDLGLLAQTAELLATRKGPVIAVLGDGPGHRAIRDGGRNLILVGLVDDATYHAAVENALAGIVTLGPGVADSVVPSKLAGYLAAGCPVIVAAGPRSEAVRVVEDARCGFTVPAGRSDLLAEALCRIANDPEGRARSGARGKAYATAHWDKEHIVDQFGTALQSLTAGSTR